MEESTVDIVRTLWETFDPVGEIKRVDDNGDGTFDIYVCKLFNSRPKRTITINGEDYNITAVNVDAKVITVTSADDLTSATEYRPPHVYFFHGTPLATGQELVNIKTASQKIPMLYLFEIIKDKRFPSPQDALDRETGVRLFFLDQAEFNSWDTDRHYDLAIMPMARWATEFLDEFIYFHKSLDHIEPYEFIYHPKFDPQISQNGVLKSLWADQMSGVEANILLPVRKSFVCTCDINT